jgi:hypothetical protein
MSDHVLKRLEGESLDTLVSLAIDHLLAQPIAQLIDPQLFAQQTVLSLHNAAHSETTEAWIREQISNQRSRVPECTLRESVPAEVIEPIKDAISRPVTLNRAIVGRLVEHGAVEDLLRDLLVNALQGFAKRIRPAVPGSGRASSRLRSLKKVSEGMLGGIGAEIERQAELKAKEFVDSILASVVTQAADDLCDPSKAATYGRFRGHIVDQLLDTPLTELSGELDKLDPEALVSSSAAALRALSERDDLTTEVTLLIESAVAGFGQKSAGELLEEAGVADSWRRDTESQVSTIARGFISTPGFQTWLGELLQD